MAGRQVSKSLKLALWGVFAMVFTMAARTTTGQSMSMLSDQAMSLATNTSTTSATNDNNSTCITSSTSPSCSDYVYPSANIQLDLNSLCSAMRFMPACTMWRECNSSATATAAVSTQQADCEPFNLLATICHRDTGMDKMGGCRKYNTLCQAGSVVQQCNTFTGLAHLPTTQQATNYTKSICSEMTMDGCEKCTPDWEQGKFYSSCDILTVFSDLCQQMPDMWQCAAWHSMCSVDATLYLCAGASESGSDPGSGSGGFKPGPAMKMYFNKDLPFYLLFKSWTPADKGELVGAWFAIFFLGMVYEMLQVIRARCEAWAIRCGLSSRVPCRGAAASKCSGATANRPTSSIAELNYTAPRDNGSSCCNGQSNEESSPQAVQVCVTDDSHDMTPAGCEHCEPRGRGLCQVAAVGGVQGRCRRQCGCQLSQPFIFSLLFDLVRAVLTFVSMGLAYLLMLAAMSFNVAIFFSVITGLAVGSLCFGRLRPVNPYILVSEEPCCQA